MKLEFCPKLQGCWCLKRVDLESLNEVKVTVVEILSEENPPPLGRKVIDVLSYPAICHEKNKTDFYFNECVYFNIREDYSPGFAEDEVGEGLTFQRLISSELVKIHNNRSINKIVHYRLICLNEVIDVICSTPPNIVKREN